ncbi:MAG: retropepsin-like aspartic protease [Thermoplasmata archaeon]
MKDVVPLTPTGGHLVDLPVLPGRSGSPSRFILDTGIGPTLVSRRLASRLGVEPNGESFVGRRMSGQEISVPLAVLPRLRVGGLERRDLTVGIFDFALPAGMETIEGFLSPFFFGDTAFTIRRRAAKLEIEDRASLAQRSQQATGVPVRLDWDGPTVSIFVGVRLPDGTEVTTEVDTGSDGLILDARFLEPLGVHPGELGVETREGTDETGHRYVRHSGRIRGEVGLRDAPGLRQVDVTAIFQSIIYDGLLGDSFLREFDVTYDLPGARLLCSPARD